MYRLEYTTRFKKDLKRVKRRASDFRATVVVLKILEVDGVKGIPQELRAHKLRGAFANNWECHIKPDLLIIWLQIEEPSVIRLIRIGSHSDLFK